jgi:predicted AAA+ superfamily ATPase
MIIPRLLLPRLAEALTPGKVLILYGPRQVGKTTLVRALIEGSDLRYRFLNADELSVREALATQDRQNLAELVADVALLVVDEAQRVPEIGLNLKILVDSFPQVAVIATGSASLELASRIAEPLTGRTSTFVLYPIGYGELRAYLGAFEARQQLDRWLIWGGYPEIVTTESATKRGQLLDELVGAYLYRDILQLDGLRRADKIVDLLRLLAFQIGREVSISELASSLALNRSTVERYLDLLEKVFVIFKRRGYSRNLRKEVAKSARYYFFDNGVRNSLIRNLNPPELRDDVGQLWENYLVVERAKSNELSGRRVNAYFWRTYDQREIDLIEEHAGHLHAFELKWRGAMKAATERVFREAYPEARLETITRESFERFLA